MRHLRHFLAVLALTTLAGCATLQSAADWWNEQQGPPAPPPVTAVCPDEIDPAGIVWDEPAGDVGAWACTATLGTPRWAGDGVEVESLTGTEAWPVRQDGGEKPTVGNWWLCAEHTDARIHCATAEWLGRGKLSFGGKRWDGTDNFHGEALNAFRPRSGTVAYVLASGCARAGAETVKERSQLRRVVVP
jgi:hypothetical protein